MEPGCDTMSSPWITVLVNNHVGMGKLQKVMKGLGFFFLILDFGWPKTSFHGVTNKALTGNTLSSHS